MTNCGKDLGGRTPVFSPDARTKTGDPRVEGGEGKVVLGSTAGTYTYWLPPAVSVRSICRRVYFLRVSEAAAAPAESTQLPDTVVRWTGTPSTVKHGSRLRLRFTNRPRWRRTVFNRCCSGESRASEISHAVKSWYSKYYNCSVYLWKLFQRLRFSLYIIYIDTRGYKRILNTLCFRQGVAEQNCFAVFPPTLRRTHRFNSRKTYNDKSLFWKIIFYANIKSF